MASTSESLKRLSDDNDFEVANGEPDVRGWAVKTASGQTIGTVSDLVIDSDAMKVRQLEVSFEGSTGASRDQRALIPIEAADLDRDDQCVIIHGMTPEQIRTPRSDRSANTTTENRTYERPSGSQESKRLTRAEEELRIGKRAVQAGEVRVRKHVETEHVSEPISLEKERVHVERRPVTDASRTDVRIGEEGELVVPIMEEQAVVDKRAVAKEEVVISKDRVSERDTVEADVRKERFDVDESGAADRTRSDLKGRA